MNSVTRLPDAAASSGPASSPSVDVVVPVHNEQGVPAVPSWLKPE